MTDKRELTRIPVFLIVGHSTAESNLIHCTCFGKKFPFIFFRSLHCPLILWFFKSNCFPSLFIWGQSILGIFPFIYFLRPVWCHKINSLLNTSGGPFSSMVTIFFFFSLKLDPCLEGEHGFSNCVMGVHVCMHGSTVSMQNTLIQIDRKFIQLGTLCPITEKIMVRLV